MKFAILIFSCAIFMISCNQGQISSAFARNGLPRPDYAAKVIDLPEPAQKRFMQSVEGFLRDQKIDPKRPAISLGWDCLAANALLDAGETRARDKVLSIAKQMAAIVIRSKINGKPIGWSADIQDARCANVGHDAFGDGTCNPKDTTYAIETGLGIACLAKASIALGDPGLLSIAKDAFAHWQEYLLPKALCNGCLYYATSDNANDKGRYVRNMNVFMALGAAILGSAANNREFTKIASQAMQSELAERQGGNRGYLGKLDPQWISNPSKETNRIENHTAAVAVAAAEIGSLVDSKDIEMLGLTEWRDWALCDNEACHKGNCNYWGGNAAQCQATLTAAHCAFRLKDPLATSQCSGYLLHSKYIQSFGMWATLVGGRKK